MTCARWLCCSLLAGCVLGPQHTRPLHAGERAVVVEAVADWEQAGLTPLTDDCREDLTTIRVARPETHEEMRSLSGTYCGPNGPCAFPRRAFYRRGRDPGVWPFALAHTEFPLLVVWAHLDALLYARLLRHEAGHWLTDCTNRTLDGGIDGSHQDRAIWDVIR